MAVWPRVTVPRETTVSDTQKGFAGGINTIGDAFSLAPNQMTRAENVRLTKYGSATKRGGTQRVEGTPAGPAPYVQGGYCWRKADGTRELMFAYGGSCFTAAGVVPALAPWSAGPSGLVAANSTDYINFAAFVDSSGNEVVFIASGDSTIYMYDGATFSAVAGSPAGIRYLTVYNQRLFGITGEDQTIWYSALNDGETLGIAPDGGAAVVRTFGDQKLTSLLTLRDSLVLFHASGTSRFTGLTQDDIAIAAGVQGFSSDIGTLFPRSVAQIDGVGYFMSSNGAYRITDAGISALDTPRTPDPTSDLVLGLDDDERLLVTCVCDSTNKEVRWSIPGSGLYVYNYRLGAWTGPNTGLYFSPGVSAMWNAVNDDTEVVIVGTVTTCFTYLTDVEDLYLDNVEYDGSGGDSYSLAITCHRMFSQRVESEKSLRWGYLFADLQGSTTTSVTWVTHHGSGSYTLPNLAPGSFWGSSLWGGFIWGSSGSTRFRVPMGGRGPFFDIIISDDSDVAPIYSLFELIAFDLGPRG